MHDAQEFELDALISEDGDDSQEDVQEKARVKPGDEESSSEGSSRGHGKLRL